MKYTTLPISGGYGEVHMNRFRICARPPANRAQVASIGANLMGNMVNYMAASSASVKPGDYDWNGSPTLKFRGVARIRPFQVGLPVLPGIPVPVPIPGFIRDWMAPDVHTDSVGLITRHATGFTVQTLKREYEDRDDATIRAGIRAAVNAAATVIPGGSAAAGLVADKLGDIAVDINQRHFLSGRRAFRCDWGTAFGYTDDRVVFETAAIERFTNQVYAMSVVAMGTVEEMIRKVWVEMVTQLCRFHNLTVISEPPAPGWKKESDVHYVQDGAATVATARGNPQYPTMNTQHRQLLP